MMIFLEIVYPFSLRGRRKDGTFNES